MTSKRGFTLVEVSIVVAIIALIIGGVMAGSSLMRQARLQSIMADKKLYIDAIRTFRDRYNAFPGDFSGATAIWGAENAVYNTCAQLSTASTTKATCDGDGDDSIYGSTAATFKAHERFRMWQHLANAGLITGSFSGVNNCSSNTLFCYVAGRNAPVSKLQGATWAIYDTSRDASNTDVFSGQEYHHIAYFGGEMPAKSQPFGKMLLPEEAWALDQKFDDALPGKGNILSLVPIASPAYNANNCATTAVSNTAAYNTSSTDPECVLVFQLGF